MGINNKQDIYSIKVGNLPTGRLNLITDVAGIKVGHSHIKEGDVNTGVTALIPCEDNVFLNKLVSATHVINGFGKSVGLTQIDELGSLETPIVLTNTLSVGECSTALIRHMLEANSDIGLSTGTVNPVVCECNDGNLNDIRGLHVTKDMVYKAINGAEEVFSEGDVGAGAGMRCFGLKGGIGSASRVVNLDEKEFTVGVLVMSNFGSLDNLRVNGENIGRNIKEKLDNQINSVDKGSVIIIVATDVPLNDRQLKRVLKRTGVGLARLGSYYGNGSGDIAVGFSTANRIPHYRKNEIIGHNIIHEDSIDKLFEAVAEATEESVLSSMLNAKTTIGRNNNTAYSLSELIL